MRRKRIYFVVIMLMTLYLGSITVSANTKTGTCGDNATWTYDSDTKVLTISGTGAMRNYDGDGLSTTAPYGSLNIETVIIQDGITSIGNYAFYYCSDLYKVTIPSSVKTIGCEVFFGCNISSLTINKGVKTIGDYAFAYNDFTRLTIPSSVKTIGYASFVGCKLTSVTIPASVTKIGHCAFSDNKLKTLVIQNGVKTIGDAAFRNNNLTSVTIPASVTKVGNCAFSAYKILKTVFIKGRKTSISKYAFVGSKNDYSPTNANLIIYGYKGSTAEKYATKYKMGFRTFGVKVPSGTSIKSLSKNKTRAKTTINLKKVSGAWKYEIQVSKTKSFSGEVVQVMTTKTKGTFKGFPTKYVNRTIYVRARVYKKIKGKLVVSNWSKVKSTKMKK